jgi:hypothetical protein
MLQFNQVNSGSRRHAFFTVKMIAMVSFGNLIHHPAPFDYVEVALACLTARVIPITARHGDLGAVDVTAHSACLNEVWGA